MRYGVFPTGALTLSPVALKVVYVRSSSSRVARVWMTDSLAVTLVNVDFLDPAVAHEPDARERGVRLELRPVATDQKGSIYAADRRTLLPAVCRIDLLESRPGAADRMHWHPAMHDGEPGDRTFDRAIPANPLGWLAEQLLNIDGLLTQSRYSGPRSAHDIAALADLTPEIVQAAGAGLEWAREPWPDVEHDARGMAILT
jgi:hypothetical protein